ncbi:MAG: helix-turn-helix domain-containing protein [Candidatus Ornithomonoglobus sp.]
MLTAKIDSEINDCTVSVNGSGRELANDVVVIARSVISAYIKDNIDKIDDVGKIIIDFQAEFCAKIAHIREKDIIKHLLEVDFLPEFPPSTKHFFDECTKKRLNKQVNDVVKEDCDICKDGPQKINIKHKRMSKGLTQDELANKLGIKRTTVSMWETGKSNPTADRLLDVAQVLECTVDELYKGSAE